VTTERPIFSEGLRLFFPAAAIHGAMWPLIWVVLYGFGMPLAGEVPTSQWHAHEMIFGTYGMALAGFLTSAVPEWTNTPRLRGNALLAMLILWLPGRLAGLFGADWMIIPAGLADTAFLAVLAWAIILPMIRSGNRNHAAFGVWVPAMLGLEVSIRAFWVLGFFDLSAVLLHCALVLFVVLMALSMSRINVVVINNALDPSGETRPYRPHPGRRNLAGALTAAYAMAIIVLPNSQAPAFLALAAAAAFFDRQAEWFIGRALFRAEVLLLAGANLLSGLGLAAIGLSGLGLPVASSMGMHVLSMGALGLAVLAVFSIAGLRHTGRALYLPRSSHVAFALIIIAVAVRVLPELGIVEFLFGLHYAMAAMIWGTAFTVWLIGFLPFMLEPNQQS